MPILGRRELRLGLNAGESSARMTASMPLVMGIGYDAIHCDIVHQGSVLREEDCEGEEKQ